MTTYAHPSLASIGPPMSPVCAPESNGDRSWAPYLIRSRSPSTSVCTLRRSVYGGITTTSTASWSLSSRLYASFCTRAIASRWLRFIFQLPTMSGMRAIGLLLQRGQPRELLALEVLQARAATGGDVAEPRLVDAQRADRCCGVTTTDHGERARKRGDGLRKSPRAGGERLDLEHTHGAVPEHRSRTLESVAEQLHRRRPYVQTLATRGDRVGGHDVGRGVRADVVGDDDVGRQHDLSRLEETTARLDLIGFEQRVTDVVALRRKEREAHATTDEQRVDPRQQALDDLELVRHLRAAENDDVRSLRLLGQPLQDPDLTPDEVPRGVRQPLRHVVDAGVLAVYGAERVINVDVCERSKRVGVGGSLRFVLARLAGVEAHVLQQRDVGVAPDVACGARRRVLDEGHVTTEQLAQAGRDRSEAVLRVRGAFRSAEVSAHHDPGAGIEQRADLRHAGADPPVVG